MRRFWLLAPNSVAQGGAVDGALGIVVPELEIPPVADLVERIRTAVTSSGHVEVPEPDGDDALEALAEQIQQVGMGSRSKDGTKTGAADAMIVRAVQQELESAEQVVLATGDKRLAATALELDERVVIAHDRRDLWQWHGLTPPLNEDLQLRVLDFVDAQLQEELHGYGTFGLFRYGTRLDSSVYGAAQFQTEDVRQTDIEVDDISSLIIRNLDVVEGDEIPRLVVAEIEVRAVATVVNWFIGGYDSELLDEWATLDLVVTVPISTELDEEWTPIKFEVDDKADVAAQLF